MKLHDYRQRQPGAERVPGSPAPEERIPGQTTLPSAGNEEKTPSGCLQYFDREMIFCVILVIGGMLALLISAFAVH